MSECGVVWLDLSDSTDNKSNQPHNCLYISIHISLQSDWSKDLHGIMFSQLSPTHLEAVRNKKQGDNCGNKAD